MNEIERKKSYRQHRWRIQNASSLVNSQAPKPKEGPHAAEHRKLTFIEMMGALYSKGNQRTFTQSPVRGASSARQTKVSSFKERPFRKCVTSHMSLQHNGQNKRHTNDESYTKQGKFSYSVPSHVWQRYNHLAFVKNPQMLLKLLRPKIFLDLQLCHGQPVGRLVVQLFTEACPEVVIQFVRVCLGHQQERFKFTRLLVPLWLEAELQLDDKNALAVANMEHDPTAINHGSGAGILSFPSRYLRGSKFRFISFTVSFQPIDVLNGKRIAFGRISQGQHILDKLHNFEVTRCGKPVQEIIVTSCGVL